MRVSLISPASATTIASWDPPYLERQVVPRLPTAPRMLPVANHDLVGFDEDAYLPARRLTVRPSALNFISIPYPSVDGREGAYKAVLALFIDEDGTVAKVRIVRGELPPPYARSAIDAFTSAHFHPGRLGTIAVKSRMLVEVEFDSAKIAAGDLPRIAASPGKR